MQPSLFSKKVIPVYDIGRTGNTHFTQFIPTGLTETAITWSSVDELKKTTYTFDSIVAELQDDLPVFIANDDTNILLNEGDNTQFQHTFIVKPNMSLDIIKCFLSMGFAINMSARTSGDQTFDSVTLTIKKRKGTLAGDQVTTLMKADIATGLAACDATDELRVFILQIQFDGDMIDIGDQLEITVETNHSGSGTNTIQIGMLPFFSLLTTNATKPYTISGLNSHELARMDSKRTVLVEDLDVE